MATKKYTIRKFDGDDQYSWAVFKTEDVKVMGNQIFYGEATPLMSGMDKRSAQYQMDKKNGENKK